MDLETLQKKIHNWGGEKFPSAPSYLALIKVMEELGELASHYIGRIELRVGKEPIEHQQGLEDSVADIVISLCVFCDREHVNLASLVNKTWEEVSKRQFVIKDKNVLV